ncbi:hypothetical protein [Streptomyces sp. NPDC093109]|uniref:hypothetical protein n=1 Tax=Streptomyces sp. NPDC093109 TaxID=3154977 RepID=UPI00344DE258
MPISTPPADDTNRLYLGQLALYLWENKQIRAVWDTYAVPGTEAYDGPLAESHAESWHHLDQWAIQGKALIEINTPVQSHQSAPSVPAMVTPVPEAVPHAYSARW